MTNQFSSPDNLLRNRKSQENKNTESKALNFTTKELKNNLYFSKRRENHPTDVLRHEIHFSRESKNENIQNHELDSKSYESLSSTNDIVIHPKIFCSISKNKVELSYQDALKDIHEDASEVTQENVHKNVGKGLRKAAALSSMSENNIHDLSYQKRRSMKRNKKSITLEKKKDVAYSNRTDRITPPKIKRKSIPWDYKLNMKIQYMEHVNQLLLYMDFVDNEVIRSSIQASIEKYKKQVEEFASELEPVSQDLNDSNSVENPFEKISNTFTSKCSSILNQSNLAEELEVDKHQDIEQSNISKSSNPKQSAPSVPTSLHLNLSSSQFKSLIAAQNKYMQQSKSKDWNTYFPLWKMISLEFQDERAKTKNHNTGITLGEYKRITKEFQPSYVDSSPFSTLSGNFKIGSDLIATILTMAVAFGFVASYYFHSDTSTMYAAAGIGAILGLMIDGILILIRGSRSEKMEGAQRNRFSKAMPGVQRGYLSLKPTKD